MTTRNSVHHRPKFLHLEAFVADQRISSCDEDDFDNFEMIKFDIWNTNDDYHINTQIPISKSMVTSRKQPIKPPRSNQRTLPNTGSLPVNVPDWSKILRDAYKQSDSDHVDDDDCRGGCDDHWLPPHEYLSRIRSASLSVHEGVGRTLKGRDLSRLRNAIWKQTGFEQD
ncbi:uncharacterized protein LOC111919576 [Lactuca sativa]|uniref:uncharacterized protein LOC111919576 n=1 Tax=Lactuca sativa TaxID=4236 RepID=UPI000CBE1BBE|nr:uncharacterized protein LOC111919576 [Lactuca sativa]